MYSKSEWTNEIAFATFELGIDFPADSFEQDIIEQVQARLMELYFIPKSWTAVNINGELNGFYNW